RSTGVAPITSATRATTWERSRCSGRPTRSGLVAAPDPQLPAPARPALAEAHEAVLDHLGHGLGAGNQVRQRELPREDGPHVVAEHLVRGVEDRLLVL